MTLNRLATLSLIIGSLSSVALVGCQSTKLNHSNKIGAVNSDTNNEDWSASTPQPRLLQTLTNYDWQLTQVKGTDNKVRHFNHQSPLLMEVSPNILLFKEGCHRYQAFFDILSPPPYPYSLPNNIINLPDHCVEPANIVGNLSNKGAIQEILETIFIPYSDTYFKFEPITSKPALFSPNLIKKMALKVDDGRTFTFTGNAKPKQNISGLSITNELLESYQWRLINAVDDKHQPIEKFNYADAPIIGRFHTDEYRQTAGFSVGCNGAGGPYTLSKNQTLLIGGGPSTMMSCGERLDDIESKFSRTISYSVSQLTINIQEDAPTSENSTQAMPNYLLTQKLDTGETFIWQNEKKESRS